MEKDTAERIHQAMNEISASLEVLVKQVIDDMNEQESADFLTAVREILGVMLIDIKTPLYKQHPDLVPDSLKDVFDESSID